MGELASIDVARREFHIADRVLHTPEFRTPDGKCHFKPPSARPRTHKDYPYTLATVRSEGQFNSIVYEERDTYRGVANRWSVMMNLQDMASLGVEPGDRVTLRSAQGVMRDVEVYECDLPRGNLLAYFPEANVLTGTAVDPRSRTPAFKATPVNVRKGNRHIGKPLRAG
jgi:anaerobic selenocysteine-containing dehydrogenase